MVPFFSKISVPSYEIVGLVQLEVGDSECQWCRVEVVVAAVVCC